MWEHLLQIVLSDHLGGYTFEPQKGRAGYARILTPDRRPYQTKDGYVCALIYNDKQWKAFFDIIGKPEMRAQPEFATQEARSQNYKTAYAMIAEEMKARTTAFWLEALEKGDIPVQRMNSLDDIVSDPHLKAIGYLQLVDHPSEGRIRMLAVPSEWSESKPEYGAPPAPGRAHARGAARSRAFQIRRSNRSRDRAAAPRAVFPT
jgi:crotonobetainyl-CoA:carnitine CoA-transferase CaiB-like acyl-CoA transferase